MKKAITIALIILFAISSGFFIKVKGDEDIAVKFKNAFGTKMYLSELPNPSAPPTAEGKIDYLKKISAKYNANICRPIYDVNENSKEKVMSLYMYLPNEAAVAGGLELTNKKNIVDAINSLNRNEFISNIEESKQGRLKTSFHQFSLRLKPLDAMTTRWFAGEYYFHFDNEEAKKQFIKQMEADDFYHISEQAPDMFFFSDIRVADINLIYTSQILLFALICLMYGYVVVSGRREFSVQKLLGQTDGRIALNAIKKNAVLPILIAIFVSLIMVALYYNNRIGNITSSPEYIIKIYMILILSVLVVFSLTTVIVIKTVKLKDFLNRKNNYPNKITFAIKVMTASLSCVFLLLSIANAKSLSVEYDKMKVWDSAKEYAEVAISTTEEEHRNYQLLYPVEVAMSRLMQLGDKNGGILFSPSNRIRAGNEPGSPRFEFYFDDKAKTRYERNFVIINNNYLDKNVIRDIHNKPVKNIGLKDKELTVLVPEKYRAIEKELMRYIPGEHRFQYYVSKTKYKEALGEIKDAERTIKELLEKNPDGITEKIIYIKNNQALFSFNPTLETEGARFVNPLLFIMNDTNFCEGGNQPSYAITNRFFYFKVASYMNPGASIKPLLEKTHLESRLLTVTTIYDVVVNNIEYLKIGLAFNLATCLVALIILLFSMYQSIKFYILVNIKKLAVQFLLGRGFWGKYSRKLMAIAVSGVLSFGLSMTTAMFIFPDLGVTEILIVNVALVMVESLMLMIMAKVYEKKNIVLCLKEEMG